MNPPLNKSNKNTRFTARLFLAAALLSATSAAVAEDASVAYVDSVLKWGAWELDIEPAAGGISTSTPRALNARSAKVTLRTNSIAALAPSSPGGTPVNPIVPGTPVPPPVNPILPGGPTITPIGPGTPPSVGGPGGTAPAPTIITISPSIPIPSGGPGSIPSGGPGT